jgi:hypothetical protein
MSKTKNILGWIAVGFSVVISSFWAYWGIGESFHEGWHMGGLWKNIAGVFAYLIPMFVTIAISVYALISPVGGGLIYIGFGVIFGIFVVATWSSYWTSVWSALAWFPVTVLLIIIGIFYWIGRPKPKKFIYGLAIGIPLLIVIGFGIEPAIRVAGRVDDGIRDARLVEGNGMRLVWAPAGPGWPNRSVNWEKAKQICLYLSEDGKTLMKTPQNIWRLPTVEEAVRSMARHGRNCGGEWNPMKERAKYKIKPDKESPLWDTTSQIIYWWTSTEKDENTVYAIIYNGVVYSVAKDYQIGSRSFRAVKEPSVK